ncbi:hypothetical protein [Persephonella sp.]
MRVLTAVLAVLIFSVYGYAEENSNEKIEEGLKKIKEGIVEVLIGIKEKINEKEIKDVLNDLKKKLEELEKKIKELEKDKSPDNVARKTVVISVYNSIPDKSVWYKQF